MFETRVKDFYTATVQDEWKRLVQDAYHRLEFETSLHFLEKYLPRQGLVLDAGGGPGRYTMELAQQGYQMVLLDMTPANLMFAKRQMKRRKLQANIQDFVEASIVDLSQFPDEIFRCGHLPGWAALAYPGRRSAHPGDLRVTACGSHRRSSFCLSNRPLEPANLRVGKFPT